MRKKKIWAGQIRWLTNALTSIIGVTAVGATGFAQGTANINALPFAAVMLIAALAIWATGSFVVAELEAAAEEEGGRREAGRE